MAIGVFNFLKFLDYWSRFVIKQTHERLRPKRNFIRHPVTWQTLDLKSSPLPNLRVPIHCSRSIQHGWEWYEMGFFVHWAPHNTTIICLDLPQHFQESIQSSLASSRDNIELSDPYAVYTVLLCQIVTLYDNSVWSIRNHICNWESVRSSIQLYHILC